MQGKSDWHLSKCFSGIVIRRDNERIMSEKYLGKSCCDWIPGTSLQINFSIDNFGDFD